MTCRERAGLPAKTIRYYEDIGLIKPLRDANGYRAFRDSDLHKLAFLGRARALGFTIEDCRALLALYEDETRASADVKRDRRRAPGRDRSQDRGICRPCARRCRTWSQNAPATTVPIARSSKG